MVVENSTLRIYYKNLKPNIDLIKNYLATRLVRNCSLEQSRPKKISDLRVIDQLENLVIKSPFGAIESTLDGETESCIVISPEGRDLLKQNPGLLRNIANPTNLTIAKYGIIDSGREAIIIKNQVRLNDNDIPIAIKYQFATLSATDGDWVTYTPQIDALRLAQAMKRAQPIPDLQYVVPMIATVDMSISPFIEHSITQNLLERIIFGRTNLDKLTIDRSDRDLLNDIIQDEKKQKNNNNRFLLNYLYYSCLASAGLSTWMRDHIDDKQFFPFDLIHGRYQFKDGERNNNKLISIPELHKLWSEWKNLNSERIKLSKEDKDIIYSYRNELYSPNISTFSSTEVESVRGRLTSKQDDFLKKVKKTFYILELVIGSSKLEDITYKNIDPIGWAMLSMDRQLLKLGNK